MWCSPSSSSCANRPRRRGNSPRVEYAGETNHVTASQIGNDVTVTDTAGVDLGAGCTGNPSHCELAHVSEVRVFLGNGTDSLSASAVDSPMEIDGDAGNDL